MSGRGARPFQSLSIREVGVGDAARKWGPRQLTTKIDHGRLIKWRPFLFLDLKQPVWLSSSA